VSVENCPSCGAGIGESTKFCPDCGTEVASESKGAEKDTKTETQSGFRDDERPVTEVIKQDEVKGYIKYTAGIFLSVGIGYGLALLLFNAFIDAGPFVGTELISLGMIMGILLSPLVASLSGVIIGLRFEDSEKSVVSAAGVGSFGGFFIMVVLTIVISSIVLDGGGGGGGTGSGVGDLITNQLLSIIGFSIGVATAGSLSAFVTKRFLFE
jgi:hypothetical protein